MIGVLPTDKHTLGIYEGEDDSEREKERETKEEERMKGYLYKTSRGEASPHAPPRHQLPFRQN